MTQSNKIEKIIISGQILRPSNESTIIWFYRLLHYYLETVTEKKVQLVFQGVTNCTDNFHFFDTDLFYSFYGIERFSQKPIKEKHQIWAKIFYNNEYNEKAYKYVYEIFKDSLAVVHETEHVLINILDYYKIPYIDLNTDPIRYLDDQMFAFRSNNEAIYNRILKYKVDEEVFRLYANYQKVIYETNNNTPLKNSVLFLGQTDNDRSIIDEKTNEFYKIVNNKEAFLNSVSGFSQVLFKPHPYAQTNTPDYNYIMSVPNIKLTNENIYRLLSNRNIEKVVSISSGGCIEAKYFGKETQVLLKDSIKLQRENYFDKTKYVSVYNDFFKLSFWSDILSPIMKTKEYSSTIDFSIHKNKLRNSRGYKCYWGYEDLEQEFTNKDATKQIYADIIERLKKTLLIFSLYK